MTDWQAPRCEHGNIVLGCPHDDCVAQGEYLAEQRASLVRYFDHSQLEARRMVRAAIGLPTETAEREQRYLDSRQQQSP